MSERLFPIDQETIDQEPIKEACLYQELIKIFGINFVSGLPCGELRGFIEASQKNSEIPHLQATNENEAVAISQGAFLANRKPVLYMQNSGFLKTTNEIGSLLIPCQTPTLFVVSWRGAPGEEATQHLATGAATIPIIEALKLPYVVGPTAQNLRELKNQMEITQLPGVILMKKERFNQGVEPARRLYETTNQKGILYKENNKKNFLSREQAIDLIFEYLINENDGVFSSTGLISRSIYHRHDSPNQFYNAGAFGYTSSIALGYATNEPAHRNIIIEGDGSVLTNLGSLNIIGHSSAKNLVHIVLDNAAYASCSSERTYGSDQIPEVALTFGYKKVFSVQSEEQIAMSINAINTSDDGPSMIHIRINAEGPRDFKRPLSMAEIARRFKNYFITKS